MPQAGIQYSEVLFHDNSGFLTIATSGNTGTTGSALLRLDNLTFSLENTTIDLKSFDGNFAVAKALGDQTFSFQGEGYFCENLTPNYYTGYTSTYVTGGFDGQELLTLAQERRSDLRIYFKAGSKIKTGKVVISTFELTSSVGEVQKFSITLDGNGGLTSVN